MFAKLKAFSEMLNVDEIRVILGESCTNMEEEIDFESFLRVSLKRAQHSVIVFGDGK